MCADKNLVNQSIEPRLETNTSRLSRPSIAMVFVNAFTAVLVVATWFCSTTADLVLPPPPGPYKISHISTELVDNARPDPWNPSHPRRMMISRFDPIPRDQCQDKCIREYFGTFLGNIEDDIFEAFFAPAGVTWPKGILPQLQIDGCCQPESSQIQERDGDGALKFPLLLFGTGLNTTRLSCAVTAQHIASQGYTVVVMDHPYETDVVVFPDGTVIYGGNVDTNNTESIVGALEIRATDASFVLDTLGVREGDSVGMLGQSFGGPATATTMFREARVKGGIALDGMMFGPAVDGGLERPLLLFGSTGHNSTTDETWGQLWESMDSQDPNVWFKELSINDSAHGTYSDSPVIADVAGLRNDTELEEQFSGRVKGDRIMKITREYVDDFFGMVFNGSGQGLLEGPSEDFPEVQFLREFTGEI